MKGFLLFSSVLLSALLMSCTDQQSVAASYKERLSTGATGVGDSTPNNDGTGTGDTDPGTGDTDPGTGDTDPGTGDADPGTGDATTGDVAKGQAFLQNCKACHTTGGLAGGVTLDATAIPRLDTAYTGIQKANHQAFSAAFVDGRADLEAALNAVK